MVKEIKRNSSIELLKVLAIILIIVNHCVQTIGTLDNDYVQAAFGIDIVHSSSTLSVVVLSFLRYFGGIGNSVFFIASFWFLVDNNNVRIKKVISLWLDVFLVSILILVVSSFFYQYPPILIIRSCFPTLFNNNWFITCYLLIYLAHPGLNMIINELVN